LRKRGTKKVMKRSVRMKFGKRGMRKVKQAMRGMMLTEEDEAGKKKHMNLWMLKNLKQKRKGKKIAFADD
jgi:hypothetical protein